MPPEQQRTKHLYLLFDDWKSGYSIRKLSLSRRSGKRRSSGGSGGEHGGAKPEPVPGVFMRIRGPRGFPDLFTSGFGSKIMVMHPSTDGSEGIPMIDIHEQTFIFGAYPNCNAVPIYFPIGDDRLIAMDAGTFDCYHWTLEEHSEEQEPWSWQALPRPPFERWDVSSYGVLPDGCILVGTAKRTFIFDTKEYVWKPYSDWALPFTGRGHYDTSLDGFVGLSKHPENLGHIYCTTGTGGLVDDTGNGKTLRRAPGVKRTKEKVYNKNDPGDEHVSATLVHMRQGKFCLVECVSIDNDDGRTVQELISGASWVDEFRLPLGANPSDFEGGGPIGGRFMYRLRTFSLGYDKKGDHLKLKHCKVRCYRLPHEARIGSICMDPVAFWL